MRNETADFYRMRARAECEAAFNASCPEARHAHAQMANAYERLAQIAALEQDQALGMEGRPHEDVTLTGGLVPPGATSPRAGDRT